MVHEHAACALIELMEVGKTSSSSDLILHHAPEAFNGIEVMSTARWQEMQPKLLVPVGQRRRELMRSVNATAVDHHDDGFPGRTKMGHYLMNIVAKPFRIKLWDDLIEDFRGAILDSAEDTEQHAAGHAAPTPIAQPGLAFERLFPFDLATAQGLDGQARALGGAPPARAGQGKTPEDRFIGIEQDEFAPARLVLEGPEFDRSIGEGSGARIKPPSGAIVA